MKRRAVVQALGLAGAAVTLAPQSVIAVNAKPQVVVIGSGIAGLGAAFDLQKAGCKVTVFEKNSFAGGRMAETLRGPVSFPTGASAVFEASDDLYGLAAETGLAEAFLTGYQYPEYHWENPHGGYSATLRWHTTEVMNVPGLSTSARERLPSLLPDLARIRAEVDPNRLSTGTAWDTESVHEYFLRKLGRSEGEEVIEYWVQPGLDPWAWHAKETSMIAWLSVVARQNARWVIPQGGIGVLTRKLAERVDVKLNTAVSRITPADTNGRHTIHYLTADHRRQSLTPDVVLCAVEGNFVLPLVQGLGEKQSTFFRTIHMTEWAALAWVLHEQHKPPAPLEMNLTTNHSARRRQLIAAYGASQGDPASKGSPPLVWAVLDVEGVRAWRAGGLDLSAFSLPRVQALYPGLREEYVSDVVFLGKDDMLLYMPTGFIGELAEFNRDQEQSKRGLYFTGEYLGHAHTGGACASGRNVARTVLKHWA